VSGGCIRVTDAGAFLLFDLAYAAPERDHTIVTSKENIAMYTTKNDLPGMIRADVVAILNARLADSINLMQQAKQAHWNVKGPNFMALHKLFDEVVDAAEESMDLLAERVVQLGGTAEGTIQVATTRTGLEEYPLALTEERDHVEALSSALAAYGKSVRRAIAQTDELGDRDTADICTEISRGVDTYLWFVEAHLGSPDAAMRRTP
jgi:starvation-inducible DNA-binding protein